MTRWPVYFSLLLMLSPAKAQQQQAGLNGVIRGLVTTSSGEPAKSLHLTAIPLGIGGTGSGLYRTITNARGEYRFQKLPFWGTYRIYADGEAAGYSPFSLSGNPILEAEVTPEHPEAELSFALPPKAGFIEIHLANQRTGVPISEMEVWIAPFDTPNSEVFSMGGRSDCMILVPPDRNLLLHVTAKGFREWDESIGRGKPIDVPSESTLTLNVQLDPID